MFATSEEPLRASLRASPTGDAQAKAHARSGTTHGQRPRFYARISGDNGSPAKWLLGQAECQLSG